MLKKAGIVVAAAAATLLAVSPLAFAGDKGDDGGHGHHHGHESSTTNNNGQSSKGGLINFSNNSLAVPIQACNNDVPIQGGVGQVQAPIKDITGALSGALAIFGTANSAIEQTTDNSRECGDNTGEAGSTNTQDVG